MTHTALREHGPLRTHRSPWPSRDAVGRSWVSGRRPSPERSGQTPARSRGRSGLGGSGGGAFTELSLQRRGSRPPRSAGNEQPQIRRAGGAAELR